MIFETFQSFHSQGSACLFLAFFHRDKSSMPGVVCIYAAPSD